MNIRSLFPSRLTVAAVAGCAVLIPLCGWLGWTAGVAKHDRDRAEETTAELDQLIKHPVTGYIARLTTCQTSLTGAEASVRTQNAAVDRLRAEALAGEARAAAAVRAAQAEARAANGRAMALLQAQPNPGESRCDAAFRLHRENLQ